jgi:tight adherence protein B
MDLLYVAFAALIFVAVVLLIEGLYVAWNTKRGPEAQRFLRRVRAMSADVADQAASITRRRPSSASPLLQKLMEALPHTARLERLLAQSGKSWTMGGFGAASLAAAMLGWAAAAWFALPFPFQLGAAAAALSLPFQVLLRARNKRLQKIEAQLPDALDLMGRALRAGHAFPTALKMVGDEMKDPIGGEFALVFDEVNFGVSMGDALMGMANRVDSTDLRYFVVAVLIQRETGGNLSELLDNISKIIRERIKLHGQIRVLSAEGKMSAWVLGLLPFGAAGMIQLTNPKFLALLFTDPAGQKMVGFALFMMAVGFFVMRRIIRIRV